MLATLLLVSTMPARADVAFLMEEPYGGFGSVNPTGHAALYFNHICAETPTRLRACQPGEQGVVISRYHKVGGYDWLAVPLVPYLYAVERVEDVPETADVRLRDELRDKYRREHLDAVAPDVATEYGTWASPKGDWYQLVGSSYDRRIYGFQIETTADEDARFMAQYNDRRNISHFNLFFRNCADFSRTVLNGFFPHAIGRNYLADFGLTTPKQVARSLERYAKKNPEIPYMVFMIPQVPGSIARSHRIDGVAESLVRSKKYVIPMAFFYPEVAGVVGVTYLTQGRFSAPKDAQEVMLPGEDARVIIAQQQESGSESADAQPGVYVEYQKSPLDDHGVNLERREGDGVTGGLGGSTE
jgi:hypothetical protein